MNIYYAKISDNDELGLYTISFVDNPAVEKAYLCFENADKKPLMLAKQAQQIVSGIALRADFPIYRLDENGEPYYVVFTKDVIKQMVERYSKNKMLNNVDLQHNNQLVDGVYMIESYIIDKERGICPVEFSDVEDGSWAVSFKVENAELWDKIVNGNDLNGFSISAVVDLGTQKLEKEIEHKDPIDELIEKLVKK